MPDLVYSAFKGRQLGTGTAVDLDTDTIKAALVNATYVGTAAATLQTHDFFDDIATGEITGTGYTAGGQALAGKVLTLASNNYTFDANDVSWASATITARGAVLYKDTGAAATSPLIALFDFGSDVTSTNGTFTLQFNAAGILTLS